ncbi:MAG TPA: protein-S-isoprenylcysteine O-methyltransferase [Xanthobacteraceae bacterium]|jgi:protein-S-isoprenylcysteine O-methyltransferase Ste14|nr:protein-S-isoprenylcysteine O-methyltransferase [Xanthobacteraceae bacterium]
MTPLVATLIWWAGAIAWYVIMHPHVRRSRKTPTAQRHERVRERVLMAISFTGLFAVPAIYSFTGAPRFADHPFQPVLAWLGVLVLVSALLLFFHTHRRLGRFWSVTLEIRQNHGLVTDGIYRFVRHPMYSAYFLWALSQALLLPNWIAGPAGLVGFGTLFAFRVRREERMMLAAFGDAYAEYAARTKRIIPGVF